MSDFANELREPFDGSQEYRASYAESFMNSWIAAQIKVIREQRGLSQQQLAELIGSKQAGISRLENVNYTAWKVSTLARIARAFDIRLKISFEEFGTLPEEVVGFDRSSLERVEYQDDPVFGRRADHVEETPALSVNEQYALAPKSSNMLPFLVNPMNGEANAHHVNTHGTNSGVSGVGRIEPWWETIPARSR